MFALTENAAKKAKALLEKSGKPNAALRIRVVSGGCSGLEYKIEPDAENPKPTDTVVESFGLRVYLDAKGLLYMAGSTMDYVTSLMNSGFKIRNPQAAAECSCGQSFTV
ncbi:MAG: iron-sulfur cluster assembly accessory protein [Elusimicrobia bacterium]|nr:iron-sulfur cluster assembly accessory protein [Elusimicrobiota bacterium]